MTLGRRTAIHQLFDRFGSNYRSILSGSLHRKNGAEQLLITLFSDVGEGPLIRKGRVEQYFNCDDECTQKKAIDNGERK
jgi:hypothetical protein